MAYDRQLMRGAVVNLIGLVAKLVHPLFFVIIAWLFGTEVMGLYFLAVFVVQIADSAVSAGYHDAATIFGSAHADHDRDQDALYRVFANAIAVTLGLSVVVIALSTWGIDPLVARFYADRPELAPALHILAWSLPLIALPQILVSATKALMMMEYETAIHGFARPLVLLGTSVVAWLLDGGVVGLMWAHVATQALITVLALWAYARHFSLARTFEAMRALRIDWAMVRFALPQNLNMMCNRYLMRIDVIMLAAYGFTNHEVAFFAAAALATTSLREIKLIFSTALGPIVARHHSAGDRRGLVDDLSRVSRWTTTLVVPLALGILVLRGDILRLVDEGFTGDTGFVVLLLVGPVLVCALGLAGNAIVWTRHTGWNLVNSALVAALNTALNVVLIPAMGLFGAALATALAWLLVTLVQLGQLWWLEGATIELRAVARPWLGLFAGVAVVALLWDPAELGTLGIRIALAVSLIAGFFALMVALRHPEVVATLRRMPGWLRFRGRLRPDTLEP